MQTDILLTIPEAAKRLRISRATLYTHISAGRLVALKIGAATRIRASAIESFLDAAPRLGADRASEVSP